MIPVNDYLILGAILFGFRPCRHYAKSQKYHFTASLR